MKEHIKNFVKNETAQEVKKVIKIGIALIAISFIVVNGVAVFVDYLFNGYFNLKGFLFIDLFFWSLFFVSIIFFGFYFFESILLFSKRKIIKKGITSTFKFLREILNHKEI